MELIDHDSFESIIDMVVGVDGKVEEPGQLLEENWFFGNFLHTKPKMMSRCFSDPCPSSSSNYGHHHQDTLSKTSSYGEEKYYPPSFSSSMKKEREQDDFVLPKLIRAPSMPASGARKPSTRSPPQPPPRNNLVRAPSLPPCLRREEVEDQESEFTMGRLIRQASLSPSDMLPPRQTSLKGMTQSYSVPRNHPRRKTEAETTNMEGCKEMGSRYLKNQAKMGKSLISDLESQEVQGCKDLGLIHNKEGLSPGVVNIIPGLHENKRVDRIKEKAVRRPYLSEAWLVHYDQSSASERVPNEAAKNSAKDMKAQIKFWARAVASNVRQEC